MAQQVGFFIEQNRCMGCKACQAACKDKHDLEVGQLWRRVTEIEGGNYFEDGAAIHPNIYAFWTSLGCNHCADPACVKNCPTGAMYKRSEDGIVLHDDQKCIGCKMCMWSCPYGAPQYNPLKGKVGKCDYCIDYVQKGKDPACVSACPVRALHAGKLTELQAKHGTKAQTKGMPSPDITHPSIVIMPHKDAI